MLHIKTPETYINAPGILLEAGEYIKIYGNSAFIISGETAFEAAGNKLLSSLNKSKISYSIEYDTGYPTLKKANALSQKAIAFNSDFIIGIGGGRVLDLAKSAGEHAGLPVIAVPTIAATCAAWAAISILYDEAGQFDVIGTNKKSPVLILADTDVIAAAPERYIKAGILDTLAKWYETEPRLKDDDIELSEIVSAREAQVAYKYLKDYGKKALDDIREKKVTAEVKEVINAIIYLAGLVGSVAGEKAFGGFAHPFYFASTGLSHTRHRLHGDKVAFGLLVQFVLQDKPQKELEETFAFFDQFDLALTLKEIGIDGNKEKDLDFLAEEILKKFPGYTRFGFGTVKKEISEGIHRTDEQVKQWKKRNSL